MDVETNEVNSINIIIKKFLTLPEKEIIMISHTKKCDEGIMRRLEVSESRWMLWTGTKERIAVSLPSRTLERTVKGSGKLRYQGWRYDSILLSDLFK